MNRKGLIVLFVVLCVVAASRIWMPWDNFNAIGAIALMGGAFLGRGLIAYLLPLMALFIGDLMLSQTASMNNEYLFSTNFYFVYLAFALQVGIGTRMFGKLSMSRVLGGSVLAVAVFFLVSNFGSWLYLPYPKTFMGLMDSYAAGVPFIRNYMISQILFSLVLYVGYAYSTKRKVVIA